MTPEHGEFEQGFSDAIQIQGKLRACLSFWRDTVQASDFVLDIIEHGYKLIFQDAPLPYSIDNRSSALRRDDFVHEAISDLLVRGCIRTVPDYPQFCNPLHVVVQ